jgi:Predicted Zn-dependent hydrolases of the beta-lactamase fold
MEKMKQSRNYKNGKFENIHPAPVLSEGYSMMSEIYKTLIKMNPRKRPTDVIPSVKVELLSLSPDRNVLVWFGHSSYFFQLDGKRFLVDPVFSGKATPMPFGVKAFKGTDAYSVDDIPEIDYLLISHDHYDHLDSKTIKALNRKVKHVVCGLGVGQYFEDWGYSPNKIVEKDWDETVSINDRFTIRTATAHHSSGRGLSQNNTLWLSFIVMAPSMKLYLGGDGGYGTHFVEIGKKYGPFDLAVLENGQYNVAFHTIHLSPENVIQATNDLRAKRLLPVHSAKFVLERHPWDEPLKTITELAKKNRIPLVTPKIGELVVLNDTTRVFEQWWKGLN